MPSTYAHRVFGREILGRCPQEFAAVIGKHRQLYDIGLHGPDVLFYYRVLKNCSVNAKGYAMHARPAREFFERAKAKYAAAADRSCRRTGGARCGLLRNGRGGGARRVRAGGGRTIAEGV